MDINQVIVDITTALQDAYAVAGTTSPMDQLTVANASLATALAHATQLQTSLDAETADDVAKVAQLAVAKAKAQDLVTALS